MCAPRARGRLRRPIWPDQKAPTKPNRVRFCLARAYTRVSYTRAGGLFRRKISEAEITLVGPRKMRTCGRSTRTNARYSRVIGSITPAYALSRPLFFSEEKSGLRFYDTRSTSCAGLRTMTHNARIMPGQYAHVREKSGRR